MDASTIVEEEPVAGPQRQFLALERDVLVLSLALFAFSGLRFAGLPAHKALILGPAEAGGRVTGSSHLVRGLIVIPSGLLVGVI